MIATQTATPDRTTTCQVDPRRDFGLAWNQLLETGGVVVGDDVQLSIDAQIVAKAE